MKPIDQLARRSQRIRAELGEDMPYSKVSAHCIPRPKHMSYKAYRERLDELHATEIELKRRIAANLGMKL